MGSRQKGPADDRAGVGAGPIGRHTAQRNRANTQPDDQDAFQFLDRLRRFLLDNGSPGRQEIVIERAPDDLAEAEVRLGWRLARLHGGDQKDHGDTVLALFSDGTEVAEAEYFREFESCTVRWSKGSSSGPSGALSPEVIQGIAEFLEAHRLDWDGR
jgi:hypothetical protein